MDNTKNIDLRDGLPHTYRGVDNNRTLTGVSVDWLTVTVPTSGVGPLLDASDHDHDGHPNDGFARSERRSCAGGDVWRRWEPHQEMKDHGRSYESWVYNGSQATGGARIAIGIDGTRPSRIDLAFDFSCGDAATSDGFIDETWDHFKAKGLTAGISGQGGNNTRYIGSPSSERRVRIYRKDKQDEAYGRLHGPTLRVEQVIKGQHAHKLWEVYRKHGTDRLYSVGAAHLADMTGVEAYPTIDDIPELVHVEAASPANLLATNIKQNASWLVNAYELGIDVESLVMQAISGQGKTAKSRRLSRRRAIERAGVEDVVSLARIVLRGDE